MDIRFEQYNKVTRKMAPYFVAWNSKTLKYDVCDFRTLKAAVSFPNFVWAKETCEQMNAPLV